MATKYIFVTGGVLSSLGKGLAAASMGCLLESRGLKVNLMKFDPYLNVDPGTMSPFQHGEVFVTDDSAETDLDLGHYERFTHAKLSRDNNWTTGRIYETRSEEHTSELQSRQYLVCRLLLEKKNDHSLTTQTPHHLRELNSCGPAPQPEQA